MECELTNIFKHILYIYIYIYIYMCVCVCVCVFVIIRNVILTFNKVKKLYKIYCSLLVNALTNINKYDLIVKCYRQNVERFII